MLKMIMVTLLAADATVTYVDGATVPARKNYGSVAKAFAWVVGERYAKNLTIFPDKEGIRELLDEKPHWIVARDTYSKQHGLGMNVEYVGTVAKCVAFIEKEGKEKRVDSSIFDEAFGPRIHKADKTADANTSTPNTDTASMEELLAAYLNQNNTVTK